MTTRVISGTVRRVWYSYYGTLQGVRAASRSPAPLPGWTCLLGIWDSS